MKKGKKAIGYVCDIPIPRTDVIISKEDQKARIIKYAEKENLELVCIYEDAEFTDDFAARPGVKMLLDCKEGVDTVLVERVWCMSRKMKDMRPFLADLDAKGVTLTATSYLWDCVSQDVRHRYCEPLPEKARKAADDAAAAKNGRVAA